jgi:hypothetical protein
MRKALVRIGRFVFAPLLALRRFWALYLIYLCGFFAGYIDSGWWSLIPCLLGSLMVVLTRAAFDVALRAAEHGNGQTPVLHLKIDRREGS